VLVPATKKSKDEDGRPAVTLADALGDHVDDAFDHAGKPHAAAAARKSASRE